MFSISGMESDSVVSPIAEGFIMRAPAPAKIGRAWRFNYFSVGTGNGKFSAYLQRTVF